MMSLQKEIEALSGSGYSSFIFTDVLSSVSQKKTNDSSDFFGLDTFWHSLHPPQTPSVITMAWSFYLGKSRRKSSGFLIWLLVSNMFFNPVWDDGPQMSTISLYIFRGLVETSNQSYMDVYGFRLHHFPESARPWVQ